MLTAYGRLLGRLAALERVFGVALILLIVVAIAVQVFTRYAFDRPIAWVEESATYAFIWLVFIGAGLALKLDRHILIDTFMRFLPRRGAAAVQFVLWLLALAFLTVLIVQGWKVIGVEGRSRTIALPIELPRSWFYSVPLTVSAVSMWLTALYRALIELGTALGRPMPAPALAARGGLSGTERAAADAAVDAGPGEQAMRRAAAGHGDAGHGSAGHGNAGHADVGLEVAASASGAST